MLNDHLMQITGSWSLTKILRWMYFTLFKKNNLKFYQGHLCAAEVLHRMLINNPLFLLSHFLPCPLPLSTLFLLFHSPRSHLPVWHSGKDIQSCVWWRGRDCPSQNGNRKDFLLCHPFNREAPEGLCEHCQRSCSKGKHTHTRSHVHRIMRKSWFQF